MDSRLRANGLTGHLVGQRIPELDLLEATGEEHVGRLDVTMQQFMIIVEVQQSACNCTAHLFESHAGVLLRDGAGKARRCGD